jgi:ATP-binding cassette subfamily B protein
MNHKSGRVEEILLLIYTMPTLTKTIKNKILVILRLDVALRLVWQCSPGLTTANFIILLVQGTLPLLSLYLMKLIIDSVTAGFSSPDTVKAMEQVIIHVAMLGGVALLDAAVQSLGRFVNESQSLVVTDKMHEIIHAKSVAVDLEYYENPKYYDTLHRAQREAAFRPTKIVNSLAALLKNSFSLIAVALLLFSFHWGITLLLLMAGLPALFVKIFFADSLYKLQQQQTQTERRAWYYNWLVTNEAHAKEIRIFNLRKLFIEQYKILREKLRVEKLSITAKKAYYYYYCCPTIGR